MANIFEMSEKISNYIQTNIRERQTIINMSVPVQTTIQKKIIYDVRTDDNKK